MPKVYIFGFAQSLNDSTVYFTDIQELKNVWVDDKTTALYGREGYSQQMKNHIAQKDDKHICCITSFALTRKQIEKKYAKLKQRYTTRGHYQVNYINENEMQYKAAEFDQQELEEQNVPVQKEKKGKKEHKKVQPKGK